MKEEFYNLELNNKDSEEGIELSYIPEEKRIVEIDRDQFSIFELHRRYLRGDIILKPPYQRESVWPISKKSKLIESALIKIPIPSIFFAETYNDKWEVVDGQQRLRAFFEYLNCQYKLNGLPVLYQLNGKGFDQIGSHQRRLEDYQLHVFIIKKTSHPDIRFDVFERINEGATPLNAQELRNTLYRGYKMDFLQTLCNNSSFKKVIGKKVQISRLKDQEAVLRYLSFYIMGYIMEI